MTEGTSPLQTGKEARSPLPIILDTDIGNDPDDLLALAMVLDRPEFDLRAVVTTGVDPESRGRIALEVCRRSGREIPVGVGLAPAGESGKGPTRFHRETILGNAPSSGKTLENGLALLARTIAAAAPGELTLVTIGPMTTLASFLRECPTEIGKLKRVVSMGGFLSRKSARPLREHNFSADPDATRRVLAGGFDHSCVTKNVCQGMRMTWVDLERLSKTASPVRSWAFSLMERWFEEDSGEEGKILHDPLTLVAAVDEGPLVFETVEMTIDDRGRTFGRISKTATCRATIGGTPEDRGWFDALFYE